jgi:hypothetical protein
MHACGNPECRKLMNMERGDPFVRQQVSDEIHFFCSEWCRSFYMNQHKMLLEAAKPFHDPFKPPSRRELASR